MAPKFQNITHCKDCGENLDLNPVYTFSRGVNRRRSCCKSCTNNRQRKANLADPSKIRNTQLKYRYNISLEDYNKLLEAQNGTCAICRKICTSGRDLGTDHNHLTGEVRGLLCHRCNRAIGLLQEDPELISSAYDYLSRTTWNRGLELVRIRDKKESA